MDESSLQFLRFDLYTLARAKVARTYVCRESGLVEVSTRAHVCWSRMWFSRIMCRLIKTKIFVRNVVNDMLECMSFQYDEDLLPGSIGGRNWRDDSGEEFCGQMSYMTTSCLSCAISMSACMLTT